MTKPVYIQALSDAQRQFVAGAETMGATGPARARKGAELPRISARELEQLLDIGVVREAAEGVYYLYPRAQPLPSVAPPQSTPAAGRKRSQRFRLLLILWIVILVIPLLVLLLRAGQ